MWDSNSKIRIMQKSSISRESLRNYKFKDCDVKLLNKTIIGGKTDIEIADVTPICKLLYTMIHFKDESMEVM
jgi:hypothetical protein